MLTMAGIVAGNVRRIVGSGEGRIVGTGVGCRDGRLVGLIRSGSDGTLESEVGPTEGISIGIGVRRDASYMVENELEPR